MEVFDKDISSRTIIFNNVSRRFFRKIYCYSYNRRYTTLWYFCDGYAMTSTPNFPVEFEGKGIVNFPHGRHGEKLDVIPSGIGSCSCWSRDK